MVKNLQLCNVRDNSMAERVAGMGGDCDPVSMRCCGFIQTLHQRRYLWKLGSGFNEVS